MGVNGFLEILRRFYSLPIMTSNATQGAPPAWALIVLSPQERAQIRLFILQSIRFLIEETLTEKEKEVIMDHLSRVHETDRADVIQAFAPFFPASFTSSPGGPLMKPNERDEITVISLFDRNRYFYEKKVDSCNYQRYQKLMLLSESGNNCVEP